MNDSYQSMNRHNQQRAGKQQLRHDSYSAACRRLRRVLAATHSAGAAARRARDMGFAPAEAQSLVEAILVEQVAE